MEMVRRVIAIEAGETHEKAKALKTAIEETKRRTVKMEHQAEFHTILGLMTPQRREAFAELYSQ